MDASFWFPKAGAAAGAEVVGQLLCNGAWEKVVTVGESAEVAGYGALYGRAWITTCGLGLHEVVFSSSPAAAQGAERCRCHLSTSRSSTRQPSNRSWEGPHVCHSSPELGHAYY
jgi:hypothetical protein